MLDRKLVRDLATMRGQVLTIAAVVASGVAIFVASLSTRDSLRWTQQHFYAETRFPDLFATLKRAPEPLADRLSRVEGVAQVATRLVFDVTLDVAGYEAPVVGRMISVPEGGRPALADVRLARGRWIEPGARAEVVVSEAFAEAQGLGPGDAVAAILNGRRERLRIAGVGLSPEYVFALRGEAPIPDDERFGILWIGRDALAAAFDMEGAFNDVVASVAPGASEEAVLAAFDRILEPYGTFGAYGRDLQTSNRFLDDEIRQNETMATTIPVVFLGVAAFLLNVVIGRIIATQREQIAAIKAVGYANAPVVFHYLKFVLVIAALGAALGLGLGIVCGRALTNSYTMFLRLPGTIFHLEPRVPVLAVAVSLAAAVAGSVGALRRVLALRPAEAMRPAAPRRVRRSVLERLGAGRWLGLHGRMIARNVAARPVRAALTVLGIAFSLGIVVLGLFWWDATDALIDIQFRVTEVADATVAFTDPVPERAVRELAGVPGIRAVEGVRAVPVRVRAGHRSYRTALLGYPEDAELRRILDERLRRVPLPAAGVLLTDRLAERLGVRAGEWVRVEVLEGERPQIDVPVTGLVGELIGLGAYMEVGALRRLLGEAPAVSAAAILVDAAEAPRAYAALKERPHVATVVAKDAALAAFEGSTAKLILVFTGVLTAFAVVIAVGVVYNTVRIALHERAWELASLRVLGFTRAEVASQLLGELAAEILVAIPLGLALGYWGSVALIRAHETEMFRVPIVVEPGTYAVATTVVLAAGAASAWIVRRRIDGLDLVGVLKTRE